MRNVNQNVNQVTVNVPEREPREIHHHHHHHHVEQNIDNRRIDNRNYVDARQTHVHQADNRHIDNRQFVDGRQTHIQQTDNRQVHHRQVDQSRNTHIDRRHSAVDARQLTDNSRHLRIDAPSHHQQTHIARDERRWVDASARTHISADDNRRHHVTDARTQHAVTNNPIAVRAEQPNAGKSGEERRFWSALFGETEAKRQASAPNGKGDAPHVQQHARDAAPASLPSPGQPQGSASPCD